MRKFKDTLILHNYYSLKFKITAGFIHLIYNKTLKINNKLRVRAFLIIVICYFYLLKFIIVSNIMCIML